MKRIAEVACGYSNLEYNLEAGRRGNGIRILKNFCAN